MRKKLTAMLIAAVLLLLSIVPAAAVNAAANQVTIRNNTLYNDYVKLQVCPDDGILTFITTGGNPGVSTDRKQSFLFDHTSFASVLIDETPYKLNDYDEENPNIPPVFDANTKSVTFVRELDGMRITQVYTLVPAPMLTRDDTVKMTYTVENISEIAHQAGLRIMLDTKLGSFGDVPYLLPDGHVQTRQGEFTGNHVPALFMLKDDIQSPSMFAQGYFLNQTEKPDKLQFTEWAEVYNTLWETPVHPDKKITDGAVTATWYEKTFAPGEKETYTMYYGLGDISSTAADKLSLSAAGEETAVVNAQNSLYQDTVVTATVKNNSGITLENIKVNVNLPKGMTIRENSGNSYRLPQLKSGQQKQFSWVVELDPSETEKTLSYSVTAGANDVEPQTVPLSIQLPAVVTPTIPQTNAEGEAITSGGMLQVAKGDVVTYTIAYQAPSPMFKLAINSYYDSAVLALDSTYGTNGCKYGVPFEHNELTQETAGFVGLTQTGTISKPYFTVKKNVLTMRFTAKEDGYACIYYSVHNSIAGTDSTEQFAYFERGIEVTPGSAFTNKIKADAPEDVVLIGDINNDGNIDMRDVLITQRGYSKLFTFTQQETEAADVNGDGTVDLFDILIIRQYVAERITHF